ncbi:unnamed protein product [Rhodiola kirilowii]
MMTMSMHSKRERRPNVRLEEIGNLPAAVSFVHKVRSNSWQNNRRLCGGEKTDDTNVDGYKFDLGYGNRTLAVFSCLDSVKVENVSLPADMQQNIENNNPNSCKLGCEYVGLCKPKVDFGNVTKKRRVMKRKKQTTKSGNCSLASGLNSSRSRSYDTAEDTKKHAKGTYKFNSFGSSDIYPVVGSTSHSGPEISTTSKQDFEDYLTEPSLDIAHHTEDDRMPKEDAVFYNVDRWLEEKGFGKYVEIFEMHEVDEEALPLLTFEDLKEMGVKAVGPRRKLFNVIQDLRETYN